MHTLIIFFIIYSSIYEIITFKYILGDYKWNNYENVLAKTINISNGLLEIGIYMHTTIK